VVEELTEGHLEYSGCYVAYYRAFGCGCPGGDGLELGEGS
jgi:hypothetical protein